MGVFIAYGVLTDRFLTALILTDCSQLTETYCCYSCLDLLSMISQQLSVAETTSLKSLRLRKLRDLSQFVLPCLFYLLFAALLGFTGPYWILMGLTWSYCA